MLTKHELNVHIDRPPEQVFEVVTDLPTWDRWHPSGQEVVKATPGPVGVGTVWRVSGRVQGRVIELAIEVTRHEPHRAFAFVTSGPIQARQAFTFAPVDGGTALTTVLEVTPELAAAARERWSADLLTLKRLIEG